MGLVSKFYQFKEQSKIRRFKLSQEAKRQNLLFELLRLRWRFLALLVALIIVASAIDALVTNKYSSVLAAYYPSIGTVNAILGAIIAGTAAILAILISISLVVLQMGAERYRSRMIRFLIREKVGNYVLDLLAVTLLFSLWILFLVRANTLFPYLGLVVSCILATVSVVSLIIYRGHALSVFQPEGALRTVLSDIGDIVNKVAHPKATLGRRVENHVRERVSASIDDIRELSTTLLSDRKDDNEGATTAIALCRILQEYTCKKRLIPEASLWFLIQEVPLTPENGFTYTEMRQMYERLGLGEPRQSQPSLEWLERKILASLAHTREVAIEKGFAITCYALVTGLDKTVQTCFEEQEFTILDGALDELSKLANGLNKENINGWGGELLNTLGKLADRSLKELDTERVRQAISRISWRSPAEIYNVHLPRFFQDSLLTYQEKLATELLMEDCIVTPRDWIEREIMEQVVKREQEVRGKYYGWAIEELAGIASRALQEKAVNIAGNACYMKLLMIHRAIALDNLTIALENLDSALKDISQAHSLLALDKRLRQNIFNELRTLCLRTIQLRNEGALRKCIDALCIISRAELSLGEPGTTAEPILDGLLAIGSLAFVTSELYIGDKSHKIVKIALKSSFNLSKLVTIFGKMVNIRGYGISWGIKAIQPYFYYFRPIFRQVHDLPKRLLYEGGEWSFPVEVADHPSQFIQKHSISSFGPEISDCAEGFIETLKEELSQSSEEQERELKP